MKVMVAAGGPAAGGRAAGGPAARGTAWPSVVLGSTAALVLARVAGIGPPVGGAVGLWFALTCPGAAVVGLLAVPDRAARAVLVVTVSLAVDAAVATTLFYARAWSVPAATAALAAVSVAGAALQLARGKGRAAA